MLPKLQVHILSRHQFQQKAGEELPLLCVCGHEWKETCFYINAALTQLQQLFSLFLKSTPAQDVNRPFWAMKIAIFGLERTLK